MSDYGILPKYLRRTVDGWTWPMLVVEHGKHDVSYSIASSIEEMWQLCSSIVQSRIKERWFAAPSATPYGLKKELSEAEAAALPEPYRTDAIKVRAHNRAARVEHDEEVAEWKRSQEASAGDGVLAFLVLYDRGDHEYERVEFVIPHRCKAAP